jgi:antitoxin Phd
VKRVWQLQEATNKFSEVVEEALSQGPQVITRRGVETVILLPYAEYRKLLASQKKLSEFFRQSPLADANIDLDRDRGGVMNRSGILR